MSQAGSPTGNNQMSTGQLPAQAQDMLMTLYQRGVEVGMSQATQAQTMTPQVMLPPVYASYPQSYYSHYDNTLGMYGGPNGTPPTYGLGFTSYDNPSVASSVSQPPYTQATTPTHYGQYEQVHDYAKSATSRNGEAPYVWPTPTGDIGPSSSSTAH